MISVRVVTAARRSNLLKLEFGKKWRPIKLERFLIEIMPFETKK